MTNYSLRARMMILILAPTVLIGLLLSLFFVVHRYNDLQRQLEDAGASIIEPLAVSTEYANPCIDLGKGAPEIHGSWSLLNNLSDWKWTCR